MDEMDNKRGKMNNLLPPIKWMDEFRRPSLTNRQAEDVRAALMEFIENEYGIVFDDATPLSPAIYETFVDKEYTTYEEFIPNRGDVVVDAGAQYGDYTLLCSKNGANVHAFEPHQESFAILEKNLIKNKNRIKEITVHMYDVALGDTNSRCGLLAMREGIYSFIDGKTADPVFYNDETELTEERMNKYARDLGLGNIRLALSAMVTLDSLNIGKVTHMKIDVEGFEFGVLSGSRKTLEEFHPKLIMEIHSNDLIDKCTTIFDEYGYSLKHLLQPHGIQYLE